MNYLLSSMQNILFYEHFNTSNVSVPYFSAHESFVVNPQKEWCGEVHELETKNEQCNFVKNTSDCHEKEQFLDYTSFIYCDSGDDGAIFGAVCILLLCLCCFMFTILGKTADKFFCPALAALAERMGLSENLAGVTLVAFGNGSPDIFAALANYDADTEIIYSELFGAAIFIIAVVGATIIIIQPITIQRKGFTRDVCFFMVACLWIMVSFRDETFTILETVEMEERLQKNSQQNVGNEAVDENLKKEIELLNDEVNIVLKTNSGEIIQCPNKTERVSFISSGRNELLWKQFLTSMNPIDRDDWMESGVVGKILVLTLVPVSFCLVLLIPVVDYAEVNNGWTKLLNILHIFILPQALTLVLLYGIELWHLPINVYAMIGSLILMIAVFFSSRTDRPPKYHLLFAIFGSLVGSIFVIQTVASEIVSVLTTLGLVSRLSDSLLGLSILAWGNSIGDLISNIALSRRGYARMALAACFGGPLFNSLIGIGIVFALKLYYRRSVIAFAREGDKGPNCSIFLLLILLFSLLFLAITGFQARRSIGIYLYILYCIFISFAVLAEFEIIHPYGTDHDDEGEFVN